MITPVKLTPYVTLFMIVAIGASYFVFLYASWNQFQKDRNVRDSKIDELLDRLPKPAPKAAPVEPGN